MSVETVFKWISENESEEVPHRQLEREWQIIERAKQDPSTFEPLYRKYYRTVYSYLYRLTLNTAIAEDLAAETFIKAIRSLHAYKNRNIPFQSWLYRIAHNTFISNYRREKVRSFFLRRSTPIQVYPPTAPDTVEAERKTKMMLAFIQRLKREDQLLVTMRFFQEVSISDLSHLIGSKETTIRSRLKRALQKLKDWIESECPQLLEDFTGEKK